MRLEDTDMPSPAPASPSPAAATQLSPLHFDSLALNAQPSRTLTPRTATHISNLVPRQHAYPPVHRTGSWLAVQAWQYFQDLGCETPTAAYGGTSRKLRAQNKCRCQYCNDVVAASPSTMAIHIVRHCRLADMAAKRALKTGRPDPNTALAATNQHLAIGASAQASAPALTTDSITTPLGTDQSAANHESAAMTMHATSVTNAQNARALWTLDYVGALKWEVAAMAANRVRTRLCSPTAMTSDSPALAAAAARAEKWILATVGGSNSSSGAACNDDDELLQLESRIDSDMCDGEFISADKENMPPQLAPQEPINNNSSSSGNGVGASATKRPRLGRRCAVACAKKSVKVRATPKKRLFAESATPVSARAASCNSNSSDSSNSNSRSGSSSSSRGDVETLVHDLTAACVTERVPIAFLSSAGVMNALARFSGTSSLERTALLELSAAALEALAEPVDAACDTMRESASALTFIVQRASPHEPLSSVVFLVNDAGRSALVSCQHAVSHEDPQLRAAVWLDAVRSHYHKVADWCGRDLHVCVAAFPPALQRQVADALAPTLSTSTESSTRLVGGCMAHEFALLRTDVLPLLRDAATAVQWCAELALLVDATGLGVNTSSAVPALLLLTPRETHVTSYAVLLAQVLAARERIAAACRAASDYTRLQRELLRRALEVFDAAQWATAAETLQLLRPLAAAELLDQCSATAATASQLPSPPTSGVFMCLEFWLFAAFAESPLVASSERRTWCKQFEQRQRATRVDHQLATVLLDPRIAGAGLSAVGIAATQQCVLAVSARVWPQQHDRVRLTAQLAAYVSRSGVFGCAALWRRDSVTDPLAFWRRVQCARELQQVALLVCSFAPRSPSVGYNYELPLGSDSASVHEATRAAQVRHHLSRQDNVRDPATLSSSAALALLRFILADDGAALRCDGDGSKRDLPRLKQFESLAWRLDGAASQTSILSASWTFTAPLRSAIDDAATAQRHADDEAAAVDASACCPLLQRFSVDWIDCSRAGRIAMRRAISSLCHAH